MYIAPGQGAYSPRGQSFDVSRNFLSLRSSVASFESQTTIVSEKIHCFTFFPYKSIRDQIWPCHRSRSTQGHYSNKSGSTRAPDAALQVSRSSAFWFRRWFFNVFTIYGHGGHLGHKTRTVWTNFRSPIPWTLYMKFIWNLASNYPVVSEEKCLKSVDDGRQMDDRWWRALITHADFHRACTSMTIFK